MHISEQNLKDIILDSGLVTPEQFELARQEAARSNRTMVNVLLGKGYMPESYLGEIMSKYFMTPNLNLNQAPAVADALRALPEQFSKTKRVAVLDMDKEKSIAKIAMEDPGDLQTLDLVAMKLQMRVEPYLAMPSQMKIILKEFKKDIYKEFGKIIEESIKSALETGDMKDVAKMAEYVPIITITDGVIEYAVISGASDIHIEQLADKVLVRFRIDGILRDIVDLPKEISEAIVARIKILSGLQIDMHFAPQDGRFKFKLEEQSVDVRVSVMPTFYGEKIVMRLLKGSLRPLNMHELGISESDIAIVLESIKKAFGMILITGPTGSGKTTTLYAILHILNTPDVNIATIEDPIEYDIARLNQTQVNAKAGITFANGLRSLMRQNPDIIMVGEIRDDETVGISLNAAMTGHLVLSTLHTNDAPTAIPRLIDMGGESFLVANTLNTIIAQRLVRKICEHCITSYAPSKEESESIAKQLRIITEKQEVKIPPQLYKGKGCDSCSHSGYSGQIGIFEILDVNHNIKEMIKPEMSVEELRKAARQAGMKTMFEDGIEKAEAGLTSVEEVMRVIME